MQSDQLTARYFDELIKTLSQAASVMATVAEKISVLERSQADLKNELKDLNKTLSACRMSDIIDLIDKHDGKLDTAVRGINSQADMCQQCIPQIRKILENEHLKKIFVEALREQLDPDEARDSMPIAAKQQIKEIQFKDFLTIKVFGVIGLIIGLIELIIRSFVQ